MSTGLKRFAAVISPRWRPQTKCAACGGDFACGATLLGCWCSEIKLNEEQRAELRSRYSGCLCRRCLETAASTAALTEAE